MEVREQIAFLGCQFAVIQNSLLLLPKRGYSIKTCCADFGSPSGFGSVSGMVVGIARVSKIFGSIRIMVPSASFSVQKDIVPPASAFGGFSA